MFSETEKFLAELERLANEASEGPWDFGDGESDCWNSFQSVYDKNLNVICLDTHSKEDAAFIAAAREAIPKLIDMVKALDIEAYYLAERVGDHGRCPKWERLKISCVHKVCTPENRMNCWRAEARRWRKSDD